MIIVLNDSLNVFKVSNQGCRTTFVTFFVFIATFEHIIINTNYPVNIYLFKLNNRNSRKRCEMCSKLTIKTPERHHIFQFFLERQFISSVTIVE